MKKTYLLAPTRESPPDGPIALGNIISSPFRPEDRLNSKLNTHDLPIYESYQTNFSLEMGKRKAGRLGLWTIFLQSVGIGINLGGTFANEESETFKFERVETKYFTPDRRFVETSMEGDDVRDFLRKSKFKANVYMITGIKIARGASVTYTKLREKGLHVQIGIDATPMGVPIGLGPNIKVKGGLKESTTFKSAEGFVFAYRLRELFYTRKQELVDRQFDRGAMFGTDAAENFKTAIEDETVGDVELQGIAEQDLGGEDIDLDDEEVVDDDDETCESVTLRA